MSITPDSPRMAPVLLPLRLIFRAIVMTVVPEATMLENQGWLQLEQLVDETLRDRTATENHQLRLFLRLIQWAPVLRYGLRFTSLDEARRNRFLSYLQEHKIQLVRNGFWGVRTLALLGYYGRPETAQALGYTPDSRGWDAQK